MSPDPYNSLDDHQEKPRHVVLNLDQELVCQALVECLHLVEELRQNAALYSQLCNQLCLRLSYALLHGNDPAFARNEIRLLALHHSQLATSLLQTQRQLHHHQVVAHRRVP